MNNKHIIISKEFDGKCYPDTFNYEGTIAEWKALKKDKFFEDIPCINCKDGICVQHI